MYYIIHMATYVNASGVEQGAGLWMEPATLIQSECLDPGEVDQ